MTAHDYHAYTINQLTDTNTDSYSFDVFKHDLNTVLKLYHARIVNYARDYNEYVTSVDIDIDPHQNLIPGMNGYKGEYAMPEDFYTLIRAEISVRGEHCFIPARRADLNEQECKSEYYDNCCNACVKCFDECNPEYEFEDNLIKLKWLPQHKGVMKLWYHRKIQMVEEESDKVDFDAQFFELPCLFAARRYALLRHEGQYGQYWLREIEQETQRMEKELMRLAKRKYGPEEERQHVPLTI